MTSSDLRATTHPPLSTMTRLMPLQPSTPTRSTPSRPTSHHITAPLVRYGLFFGQESRRAASSVKHKQQPSSSKQQQQQQHIRAAYDALFSHTSMERGGCGWQSLSGLRSKTRLVHSNKKNVNNSFVYLLHFLPSKLPARLLLCSRSAAACAPDCLPPPFQCASRRELHSHMLQGAR